MYAWSFVVNLFDKKLYWNRQLNHYIIHTSAEEIAKTLDTRNALVGY
jgi:hypothetical protein